MLKKGVLVLVIFLFSFSFVSGWYVSSCNCPDSCWGLTFYQSGWEDYDYCIRDSKCTQAFSLSQPLGTIALRSGDGSYFNEDPLYYFSAPNTCTTPGGCVSPVNLGEFSEDVVITIPAGAYPEGIVGLGVEVGCGSGGEIYGILWNNLDSFGSMSLGDEYCYVGEDCIVDIIAYNRLFYGDITVRGTQESSATIWSVTHTGEEQPANMWVINEDGRGRIRFTIPAEASYEAGNVELEIFDLINRIPISGQEGGYTTLTFIERPTEDPLQINVIPNTCFASEPCDIDITVLNVPIDVDNQQFELSGDFADISVGLTDPGVIVYGNHVEYTIPAGQFGEFGDEQLTILYWDSVLSQQDSEGIMVVSDISSCIPTGCDGVCPSGCTVTEDPDCGCADDNVCCPAGCTNTNDNDCSASICVPDGCNDICPESCTVAEDPDCGCVDWDACCYAGVGCTIDNDNDCSVPVTCGVNNGTIDAGEVCDAGINLVFGDNDDDVGNFTCVDEGYDSGNLTCTWNCLSFDTSGCDDDSSTSGPPPVVGPNEYLVYVDCLDDGGGDEYGTVSLELYEGIGNLLSSQSTTCLLETEEIPFIGFSSLVMFVTVLFIFYFFIDVQVRRKKSIIL